MVTEQETIVERVRKLLAKTVERGATPAEAATAAAKAQALMFAYNLELSQVEDKPADPLAAYKREGEDYGRMAWRRDRTWMRDLMHAVAVNNFCKLVYYSTSNKDYGTRLDLIGKPDNIRFCRELFAWLVVQLDSMRLEAWAVYLKVCKADGERPIHGTRYRASFYAGAVEVIASRLAAQRRENEQASADSRALIVITGKELIQATQALAGRLRASRTRRWTADDDARDAGQQAGQRVSIMSSSRQLEDE